MKRYTLLIFIVNVNYLLFSYHKAIDLFEKMMTLEPEKRITAKSALLHKFFEGMDYSSVGWYGE